MDQSSEFAAIDMALTANQLKLRPSARLVLRFDQLAETVVPLPRQRLLADRQTHPGALAGGDAVVGVGEVDFHFELADLGVLAFGVAAVGGDVAAAGNRQRR